MDKDIIPGLGLTVLIGLVTGVALTDFNLPKSRTNAHDNNKEAILTNSSPVHFPSVDGCLTLKDGTATIYAKPTSAKDCSEATLRSSNATVIAQVRAEPVKQISSVQKIVE